MPTYGTVTDWRNHSCSVSSENFFLKILRFHWCCSSLHKYCDKKVLYQLSPGLNLHTHTHTLDSMHVHTHTSVIVLRRVCSDRYPPGVLFHRNTLFSLFPKKCKVRVTAWWPFFYRTHTRTRSQARAYKSLYQTDRCEQLPHFLSVNAAAFCASLQCQWCLIEFMYM